MSPGLFSFDRNNKNAEIFRTITCPLFVWMTYSDKRKHIRINYIAKEISITQCVVLRSVMCSNKYRQNEDQIRVQTIMATLIFMTYEAKIPQKRIWLFPVNHKEMKSF